MNSVFASLPTTIFETMSGLARSCGAANLGQGFPDTDGPLDVRQAAADALLIGSNQYPPMAGLPRLREAVAAHYADHQGLELTWQTDVTITSGATEAIAAAIFGLVEPGDEVICFQPLYDAYIPLIRRAGGVPKLVTLTGPDWTICEAALKQALSSKTKLVILNNPLNPVGKVFSREELTVLAKFCSENDLIVISDEVWEHVVFGPNCHISLLSIPEMANRCVKIGSAGKIFALTGWKVGWACACPKLSDAVAKAHQFLTFTTPPNLQIGAAFGLAKAKESFQEAANVFASAYRHFTSRLHEAGFVTLPSSGTYFQLLDLRASGITEDDGSFALRAVKECGVACIPLSAFYENNAPSHLVRLCYAKSEETLLRGLNGLMKARFGS
jgi:N-succinyldiaminopimelate aminotransferase